MTTTSQTEKDLSICCVCHLPLHQSSAGKSTTFVCCSNYRKSQNLCLSSISPFCHLDCTGIPTKSELYRTLMHQKQTSSDISEINADSGSNTSTTNKDEKANDDDWEHSNSLFFCRSCDVQGSSRFLQEYFEKFRQRKMKFYNNEESVRFEDCSDESFIIHLIHESGSLYDNYHSHDRKLKKTEIRFHSVQEIWNGIFHMENENDSKQPGIVEHHDSTPMNNKKSKKISNKRGRPHSYSKNYNKKHQDKKKKGFLKMNGMDPKHLIGQPIRLFCDISNSYHVGRIIDWRTNTKDSNQFKSNVVGNHLYSKADPIIIDEDNMEPMTKLGLDPNIAKTEFLVRFLSGFDGRKVALHQWIYLEEHSLMVGLALVRVKVNSFVQPSPQINSTKASMDKNTTFQYRPAQLMLRTALEMVPVPVIQRDATHMNNKKSNSTQKILSIFFGKFFQQSVLDVPSSSNVQTITSDISRSPSIIEFMDSARNQNAISNCMQIQDRTLEINTVLACMEREEQNRIRDWHGLDAIRY